MKNLAEFKRVKVGDKFKLVYSHFPHKYLGHTREVEYVQSNAIQFEGGSWLYFPKAKEFVPTPNGFSLLEEIGDLPEEKKEVVLLTYEVIN